MPGSKNTIAAVWVPDWRTARQDTERPVGRLTTVEPGREEDPSQGRRRQNEKEPWDGWGWGVGGVTWLAWSLEHATLGSGDANVGCSSYVKKKKKKKKGPWFLTE